MTKENVADSILGRVNKRVEAVANRLSKQYKGVKPFNTTVMKPEDQLYWYEQLGQADMDYLVMTHGEEKMNEYIFNMETIKQRRSKNG